MALIKCSECGKEISDKAKMCVNCGAKAKNNNKIILSLIIGVAILLVAVLVYFLIFNNNENKMSKESEKNFVGTWELQNTDKLYNYNENDNLYTIILDQKLIFNSNSISSYLPRDCESGITERCDKSIPSIYLTNKDNEIAINFVRTDGASVLLCFTLHEENILKQRTCKGVSNDEGYMDAYLNNTGGLGQDLEISYKKVK